MGQKTMSYMRLIALVHSQNGPLVYMKKTVTKTRRHTIKKGEGKGSVLSVRVPSV